MMSNKFHNLNKAKDLMDDSEKLSTFHERFEESTKKGNEGRIDKSKKGFNADDRFQEFRTAVYFTAYTGKYGSSSVGRFLSLRSGEELSSAFIQYLQENEQAVIKGMAVILDNKAKSLISEAKKELESASDLVRAIENYNSKNKA